jgi:hypothetical protein
MPGPRLQENVITRVKRDQNGEQELTGSHPSMPTGRVFLAMCRTFVGGRGPVQILQ